MKSICARLLAGTLGMLILSGTAFGQQAREFNVIGTWSFLTNYQELEAPFWTKTLPEASNGKLKGKMNSITEMNLKGFEVLRLLKSGVFDVAAALPIYVEDGAAVIEGSDLAAVSKDMAMSREVIDAWLPEMQKVMDSRYNALILATFPFPEQVFYCRGTVNSLADLRGKKIRVQGTSQGDFVEAIGASNVTMAFSEVVPALEKGVVDCAISGTMSGFKAKFAEVSQTLLRLPVGYTLGIWVMRKAAWNGLDDQGRALIQSEMKKLEEKSWKRVKSETEEGIACNIGAAGCPLSDKGKMTLVIPSDQDMATRQAALNGVVLSRWAKRCGEACAARWTELVGSKFGMEAKAK